jgi:hypothetical protein
MRTPRPVPERLASHPFSRAEALRLVGRGELAGPSYRLITRGAYWLAGEDLSHGRSIQAFRAVLPEAAVLRGLSAAWAFGIRMAGPDDPVEVVMDHQRRVRGRTGLIVSGETVPLHEVVSTPLGPATTPERTAFDLCRRLPIGEAVAAADALLRAGNLPSEALLRTIDEHPRVKGRREALTAAHLTDPRAESPRESLLRVALIQAGLPPPVPQVEVTDRGVLVARLDLAWPDRRVAMEYDGAHHREPRQHSQDLDRHNRLRLLGWTVFQVDAALWSHPARFADLVESVRRELAQRGGRG